MPLGFHLNAALNIGISPKEVVEAIVQTTAYAGFPRALNAISVAKRVFAERGVSAVEAEAA
ncbi:carboxymuconolactone decarboxylase family protein [Streptomyces sioyaensis]|uniref:carboxymuconolactone decarboxylase family protein n=1 Tax=Streptomyces sioyaensis TaxID=67364 RepID=UPI0033E37A94